MVVDRSAQEPLKKWGKQELEAGHSIRYRTSYPNRAAGTPSFVIILYFLSISVHWLLIALTSARIPATMMSVWVPQPQVSLPDAHFRPT